MITEPEIWPSPGRAGPPRVLVVDDDAALRHLLEACLASAGFHVLQAASAVGLTEVVRDQQPDVVLLDQRMAPVCGIEALQALRSSGEQVPVVLPTGVPPEELLEAALELGADDYIAKPFSEAVLVAHVQAILRRVRWQSGGPDR